MKRLIPTCVILAGVVAAIGWMALRPHFAPAAATSPEVRPTKTARRSEPTPPVAMVDSGVELVLPDPEMMRVGDGEIAREMRERYRERLEWRDGVLAEQLALSPGQRERLAAWREDAARQLAAETTEKGTHAAGLLLGPRAMETFLVTLLDETQATAFADLKRRELRDHVDSILSTNLAHLNSAAGVREDQRERIAGILAADADAVAVFRCDDPRPLELFVSNFDKDPQALGIEPLIWELVGEETWRFQNDRPRQHEFRKELRSRIEARLTALEPVLDRDQLEKYRNYLTRNWTHPWGQTFLPPLDPIH